MGAQHGWHGTTKAVSSIAVLAVTAVSVASVWTEGNFYGGRTAAHVWWYGWVTALSTGLGALPMLVIKSSSEWWMGLANAVAAGMMTAASVALVEEGLQLGVDERWLTPAHGVALGAVVGAVFIALSQRVLDGFGDVRLSILEGVDARKVHANPPPCPPCMPPG